MGSGINLSFVHAEVAPLHSVLSLMGSGINLSFVQRLPLFIMYYHYGKWDQLVLCSEFVPLHNVLSLWEVGSACPLFRG